MVYEGPLSPAETCRVPMLLVSFGSPSAIGYAVTNIVRQAMEGCVGAHALFQVMDLDDFKAKWHAAPEEERRAVLVVSDCPHGDIVDLLSATKGPIVVSCDSFDHIVGYVMRSREMDFAPAVRFATQVVCALELVSRAPNVMRVTTEDYGREMRSLASALVGFTGMTCSDEQFETILEDLRVDGDVADERFRDYVEHHFPHFAEGGGENGGEDAQGAALSEGERDTLGVLARHYGDLVRNHPLTEASWPVGLFLDWDRPGQFLEGPMDLTGPARFLVCGPYLHLPIGRWRMSVEIETAECLSDNRLGADVFSERILCAVTMKLPARGSHGFDLDFDVVDPLLPIELRLQLLTGAIEGSLRLLDVRLSRKPSGDADRTTQASLTGSRTGSGPRDARSRHRGG